MDFNEEHQEEQKEFKEIPRTIDNYNLQRQERIDTLENQKRVAEEALRNPQDKQEDIEQDVIR